MLKTENIETLVASQKLLDQRIMKEFNLTNHDVWTKKIVAFFVELGEFINEERSFKYWSRKQTNIRSKVVEEYIDGLHFILSIGIDINYDFSLHVYNDLHMRETIYETYLKLIQLLAEFISESNSINFEQLFCCFMSVGDQLGFQEEELMQIYNVKNKKNHERQDEKY